jgi:hypothetical protein
MSATKTIRQHFRAPWSWTVWALTLLAGGALAAGVLTSGVVWVQLVLGGVLLGALVFGVRGYSVHEGTILVHRLGWATRFPLDEVDDVELAPNVTIGSIRSFGNGGLFGYVGHYRNETLGAYRAYATDGTNAVVLRHADGPIVITPDDPVAFVEAVRAERDG